MARVAVRTDRRHLAALLDVTGRPEPEAEPRRDQAGAERQAARGRLRQPRREDAIRRRRGRRGTRASVATTLIAVPLASRRWQAANTSSTGDVVRHRRGRAGTRACESRRTCRRARPTRRRRATGRCARGESGRRGRRSARRPTPPGAMVPCRPITTRLRLPRQRQQIVERRGRRDAWRCPPACRPPRRRARARSRPTSTTLGSAASVARRCASSAESRRGPPLVRPGRAGIEQREAAGAGDRRPRQDVGGHRRRRERPTERPAAAGASTPSAASTARFFCTTWPSAGPATVSL